jgi:transcriptional antiterminator RfaH
MQTWYVFRAASRGEAKAAEHLQELGFDRHVPMETRWHRNKKGREPKDRPLIPGYVFVAIRPDQSVYAALQADGVSSVLGFGGEAKPISAGFVNELKARQAAGEFDRTSAKRFRLKPGDEARVLHGPFRDQIGKLISVGDDGRVKLLLSGLFSGGFALDSDAIEAA